GSIGLPLPGFEVAVVDEQGNEVEAGVIGDLALRGRPPALFSGYWNEPEETKAAFRGDWYVTRDVGASDEDGFLWFLGRAGDVILSGGGRFGPVEVVDALPSTSDGKIKRQELRERPVVGLAPVWSASPAPTLAPEPVTAPEPEPLEALETPPVAEPRVEPVEPAAEPVELPPVFED